MKTINNISSYIIIYVFITGCAHQLKAPATPTSSLLIGYMEIYLSKPFGPIGKGESKYFTIYMRDNHDKFNRLTVKNGYFLQENVEPGRYSFKKIRIMRTSSEVNAYIEFPFEFDFIVKPKCIAYIGHFKMSMDPDIKYFHTDHKFNEIDIKKFVKEATGKYKESSGKESKWNEYPLQKMKFHKPE